MAQGALDLGIRDLAEIEVIGSGGSAIVYKAVRLSPFGPAGNETVAVKVLRLSWDPAARRRFEREQRVMARLSEATGFVPILETGETTDGSPYIIMPFYPGGSLQQRISRHGAMDWPRAVRLTEQVAQTLAAAHQRDVFHRDIKPANILLTESGQAHIADFGISLIADETLARSTSTAAFTPAYSPPESFTEGLRAVATTDVYSLAATLWALLAGHAPFKEPGEKATAVTVFGRVAMQQVGNLRDRVPSPICRFIEGAMAKQPVERPQSMQDFLADLRAAREDAYRGVEAPRLEVATVDPTAMGWASASSIVPQDEHVMTDSDAVTISPLAPSTVGRPSSETDDNGSAFLHMAADDAPGLPTVAPAPMTPATIDEVSAAFDDDTPGTEAEPASAPASMDPAGVDRLGPEQVSTGVSPPAASNGPVMTSAGAPPEEKDDTSNHGAAERADPSEGQYPASRRREEEPALVGEVDDSSPGPLQEQLDHVTDDQTDDEVVVLGLFEGEQRYVHRQPGWTDPLVGAGAVASRGVVTGTLNDTRSDRSTSSGNPSDDSPAVDPKDSLAGLSGNRAGAGSNGVTGDDGRFDDAFLLEPVMEHESPPLVVISRRQWIKKAVAAAVVTTAVLVIGWIVVTSRLRDEGQRQVPIDRSAAETDDASSGPTEAGSGRAITVDIDR